MSILDGVLLLIILLILYLGYQRGIIKQASDFIVLLISMLLSSFLSKLLCKLLYPILPFFNFYGDIKGIKSVNLIIWRLIVYIILLVLIILIIRRILIKLKLQNKIKESEVEAGLISKLFGIIMSVFLSIIFLYNLLLVINVPLFNINLKESKISNFILEKTIIISKQNEDVYLSENYAKTIIYDSNDTFEVKNDKILNEMLKDNLVTKNVLLKLEEKGKLVGKTKTIIDEIEEDISVTTKEND